MSRFKEKPKMDKPKEKPKSAAMPKQAARMMKEKYLRELEYRPQGTEQQSQSEYAPEQVEQAGRWAVDELTTAAPDRIAHQRREYVQKKSAAKGNTPPAPESPLEEEPLPMDAPAGDGPASERSANAPKERPQSEHSANAPKERQRVELPADTTKERTTNRPKERQAVQSRTTQAGERKQTRQMPPSVRNAPKDRKQPPALKERPKAETSQPAKGSSEAVTSAGHTPRPQGGTSGYSPPAAGKTGAGQPPVKTPSQRRTAAAVRQIPASPGYRSAPGVRPAVSAPAGSLRTSTTTMPRAKGNRAIKERPRLQLTKRRPSPTVGGKAPLAPKLRGNAIKTKPPKAVQPMRRAAQTAQRQMQRQMLIQAKKAAKNTAAVVKKLAQIIVKAIASLISAVAGIVGGGILLLALVIVIVIAAVASSPFGLFFAQEPNAPDTVSVAQAVGSVNMAYNSRLELLQAGDYDNITIQGQAPDWPEVLAVFAVKLAGAEVDGLDVATLDADRVDKLTAVFWDMTAIAVSEEAIEHEDSDPDDDTDDSWTEKILHITITPQTADDMRTTYAFTDYQNSALDELLSDRAALASLTGSLAITSADVREVLAALPTDLEQARKDTVQTALQLVGKVNYFWGGKSHVIGWDSRWGTLQKVWAAGSSSTGTYRPFGLDCSGFVDWVFNNSLGYIIGHGGGVIMQHRYCTNITQTEAQPGDLAFYPDDSHIGIIVGRNEAGKLLVCHCASGQNNVVVTEFSASGFTTVGRPDIFD